MTGNPRLAVFISGNGSNLQAIIDAIRDGRLDAEIALVVSNRKEAYGLVRATEAVLKTLYFPLKPYRERFGDAARTQYDADLAEHVAAVEPDLIVLVGWMHVLSASFLDRLPERVINLHPALPGTFVGVNCIERAFAAWERGEITESGCMVHRVIPEVDAGAVIAQAVVPFVAGDTLERFTARMHTAEHGLIVEALRSFCYKQLAPTNR